MLQYIPRSFLAGFIGVFVLTEFAWALGNTQAIESYQSIFFSITEWSSLLLDGLCWVLALIPYVLILLPVLFFAFASICYKKNQTDPLSTNENVHFTIIIPAYNEEKVILNSVNSMLKQNYRSINKITMILKHGLLNFLPRNLNLIPLIVNVF